MLRLWLSDPITQELLNHLDNTANTKLSAAFMLRRTDPAKLPDAIAEVELARQMKVIIETGKFIN